MERDRTRARAVRLQTRNHRCWHDGKQDKWNREHARWESVQNSHQKSRPTAWETPQRADQGRDLETGRENQEVSGPGLRMSSLLIRGIQKERGKNHQKVAQNRDERSHVARIQRLNGWWGEPTLGHIAGKYENIKERRNSNSSKRKKEQIICKGTARKLSPESFTATPWDAGSWGLVFVKEWRG